MKSQVPWTETQSTQASVHKLAADVGHRLLFLSTDSGGRDTK